MNEEAAGNGDKGRDRQVWREIHKRIDSLSLDLDGGLTGDELKDLWYRRALELSLIPEHSREKGGRLKVVAFRLGSDRYAVGIEMVREIQRAGGITPVPTAPDFVVGVTKVRGDILSVVDIRIFFGLPKVSIGNRTRILVVEGEGLRLGILVEQVDEIADIDPADIKPPLTMNKGITEDYIQGIATHRGEMIIMVDMEKILRNPRLVVEEQV